MPEIRDDFEALKQEVDRLRTSDAGAQTADFMGIVTSGTESFTDPNVFYEVSPVKLLGSDEEGSTASIVANFSKTYFVYNIGNSIPPNSTLVLVKSVPSRYVFEYSI